MSRFVGRRAELAELERALRVTSSGRGGVCLLTGEPGIGKTRLAEEFASRADSSGVRVLAGRCWEHQGAPSFWPWRAILRRCLEDDELSSSAALDPVDRESLARLAPAPGERSAPVPESAEARFAMFESVARVLRTITAARPVVIFLDDLHGADWPSLRLLQFVAREVRGSRVLVLGTYRDELVLREPPLLEILSDVARGGTVFTLSGLLESEVGRFLELLSDSKPSRQVVSTVHGVTEGNPFFVEAVARILRAEGRLESPSSIAGGEIRIPGEVHQALRRRLAPLSQAARRTLTVAAIVGRHFDPALVGAVVDLPPDRLATALSEAVDLGIVVEESPMSYHFSHHLLTETLLDQLPNERLRELHGRVGAALETRAREQTPAPFAEAAQHYVRAATVEALQRAVDCFCRGGEQALREYGYEDAAERFEQAAECITLLPRSEEQPSAAILLRAGDARTLAGDAVRATEAYLAAANAARAQEDPVSFAQAALGYAGPLHEYVDDGRLRLLEEAESRLGEGETPLHAAVKGGVARFLRFTRAPARPWDEISRRAVEIGRRSGDPSSLAAVLLDRHLLLRSPDRRDERLAIAAELRQLTAGAEREFLTRMWTAADCLEVGDRTGFEAEIDAIDRRAERSRLRFWKGGAVLGRACLALLHGRFDECARLNREAGDLLAPIELTAPIALTAQRFFVELTSGRPGDSTRATARDFDAHPGSANHRAGRVYLDYQLGRKELARSEYEAFAARGFDELVPDGVWLLVVALFAELAVAFEDRRGARTLYSLLSPWAERFVLAGDFPYACLGSAARWAGLLAGALERWDEAEGHFETAIRQNDEIRARPFAALARRDYARTLLRRGGDSDQALAAKLLTEAKRTACELGMEGFDDEESQEPRSTPVVETSPRGSTSPTNALFRFDGEVWTITYEGKTVRLRDAKGLRYLERLLRRPGRGLHVADLAVEAGPADPAAAGRESKGASAWTLAGLGHAGKLLDARARAEYSERLRDVHGELSEAVEKRDIGWAESLRTEADHIESELCAAYGLFGRPRSAANATERMRKAVTNRIRWSIRRIGRHHPALRRHLEASVRTGIVCSYVPERPVPWRW